jgi:hypothetical protein
VTGNGAWTYHPALARLGADPVVQRLSAAKQERELLLETREIRGVGVLQILDGPLGDPV